MTKKDYIRIVEDLATAVNAAVSAGDCATGQARSMARQFAKQFAYSERSLNPRFDAERFYAAVEKAIGA